MWKIIVPIKICYYLGRANAHLKTILCDLVFVLVKEIYIKLVIRDAGAIIIQRKVMINAI